MYDTRDETGRWNTNPYLISRVPPSTSRRVHADLPRKIWFQNRRQNDRRRSRPLDCPSSALMSSSSLMSDPPHDDDPKAHAGGDVHDELELEREAGDGDEERAAPADPPAAVHSAADAESADRTKDLTPDAPPEEAAESADAAEAVQEVVRVATSDSQHTAASDVLPSTDAQTADTAPTEISTQQTLSSARDASQPRTSWISNRRSASFVRNSVDYTPEVIDRKSTRLNSSHSGESRMPSSA